MQLDSVKIWKIRSYYHKFSFHSSQIYLNTMQLTYFFRDLSGSASDKGSSKIPVQDQQIALSLLQELSIQRGSLSSVLGSVLLLLNLWNNSHHEFDNRVSCSLNCAPLIPILKRYEKIQSAKSRVTEIQKWCEVSGGVLINRQRTSFEQNIYK
jgi:hypothetical protein